MAIEIGRVEAVQKPVIPQTQTDMAGEPPKGKIGIGSGFDSNGGEVPPVFRDAFREKEFPLSRADQTDADIFWAFYNADPHEWPEVDELIMHYGLGQPTDYQVLEEKLRAFLKRANEARLIKRPRKLTLRQYIGLLVYR